MVTGRCNYYGQHTVRIRLGCICWIPLTPSSLVLFFKKKKPGSLWAKRTWIQSGWPGRFWPNAPCPEAGWCARIVGPSCGRMHPTHYQFPTETFTDSQDHIVQNQPRSNLVLTDRRVLAKWIWSRCKPLCKNRLACFRPMLPIQFRCKSDPACLLGCNKCLFILL